MQTANFTKEKTVGVTGSFLKSGQGMITVTRVETTGDLRYAKVWLSVFGLQDEKEFKKRYR